MPSFKDRFNELFVRFDGSQEDFGKLFAASKNQVYDWRSGRSEPDSEMLKAIAARFRTTTDWLLGVENPLYEDNLRNQIKKHYGDTIAHIAERMKNLPPVQQGRVLGYLDALPPGLSATTVGESAKPRK